ncbi:MAG TPA: hypothetical protein P5089_01545 [Candidatus Portnoybacteria bacterium]|nr:hypothetical protein [Candidatus Portnoybacteria bacterium]
MTHKVYLWGMGLASFLAFVSFAAILLFVSPEGGNAGILILLFLSLFLALCGFFGLLGFFIRRRMNNALIDSLLTTSFREGTLLSLLLVGFLIMKVCQVFYWWTALIFLIITAAIEIAFLYQEKE